MNLKRIQTVQHGKNMLFRSVVSWQREIRYSGHFQGYVYIDGDSLLNTGAHELFYYAMEGK